MVAVNESTLNRKPGGLASRRRRSPCRSVISLDDRPVDDVTSLCHDDHQSRFPLRSRPLPRGSNNVVSSWLCGEKNASGTQPLVNNLYQGITLDSVTGLYYERYRNYSPSLGTWISQDPLQYINGANTYQFVMSSPAGNVDPTGESAAPFLPPGFVGPPPPPPPGNINPWPPFPPTGGPPGTGWMPFLPPGWGLSLNPRGWIKWQPPFLPPHGPSFCAGGSGSSSGQLGVGFFLVFKQQCKNNFVFLWASGCGHKSGPDDVAPIWTDGESFKV